MNRILYADDCLNILSDEIALPTGSVDLIYLDPPFNSKSNYNLPFKGKYKNLKPVQAFKDTWTWGDQEEEYLEILDSGHTTKALANIIRLSQNITKNQGGGAEPNKYASLSNEHGNSDNSNAAYFEGYRKHLPTL